VSWSGLLYLAFFLCSKFAISIPFLPPRPFTHDQTHSSAYGAGHVEEEEEDEGNFPLHNDENINIQDVGRPRGTNISPIVPIRNQAAAPPNYLLVLPMVPVCAAIYITSSRFFQYYHHGFDVIFGSLIGIASAWFAFRWYHLPVTRGAGWSWGARSRDRAFAVGVGRGTYVGSEGWASKKSDGRKGKGIANTVLGPGLNGAGSERTAELPKLSQSQENSPV
jgi:hypothetical protein